MLKIDPGSDVYKTSTQPTISSLGSSLICLQVCFQKRGWQVCTGPLSEDVL